MRKSRVPEGQPEIPGISGKIEPLVLSTDEKGQTSFLPLIPALPVTRVVESRRGEDGKIHNHRRRIGGGGQGEQPGRVVVKTSAETPVRRYQPGGGLDGKSQAAGERDGE